jgi:S-formylglutathione hydrolase FrmB
LGVSLITGWLPWTLMALGILGGCYLLWRPQRWWWTYLVPGVLLLSAAAAWVLGHWVAQSLFAQDLKTTDVVWIGVQIAAMGLFVGNLFKSRWSRKIIAFLAMIAVIASAGNQINKSYLQYPAVGDMFGVSSDQEISGPPANPKHSGAPLPAGPLTSVWTPTGPNIPPDGKGRVSEIQLPGTISGFQGRTGWVYYPPAYFADNAEPLPVLVLMSGQPGNPGELITGNRLQGVMDEFASSHNGIAPVVVVADETGSDLANPLCVDSSLGNVDTYISKDVPNAIDAQLNVDSNHAHWGIGGFSAGGTCAFQMATNHPDIYPNFIDIVGEVEPSLGSRQATLDAAFGGDESKFKAVNPLDLIATKKFPNLSGWFIAGSEDPAFGPGMKQLYDTSKAAGLDVYFWESPGTGHDWGTVGAGLEHVLPWLGQRLGLTN